MHYCMHLGAQEAGPAGVTCEPAGPLSQQNKPVQSQVCAAAKAGYAPQQATRALLFAGASADCIPGRGAQALEYVWFGLGHLMEGGDGAAPGPPAHAGAGAEEPLGEGRTNMKGGVGC